MPAQLIWVRTGMFAVLGIAIVAMAGCKPPPPTPTFPVSGKVVYQKKPLTTGTVTFKPDAGKGNQSKETAIGLIKEDGTYTLSTAGRDGAPLGWYKVTVTPMAPPGPDVPPPGTPPPKAAKIDKKYERPETSGISFEVKESAPPGAYDIDLK